LKLHLLIFLLFIPVVSAAPAEDFPDAEISNSQVHAKLYLPDPQKGYYRGTRFDWSGVIATLEANGHSYFGKWFERYDPKLHDAITGPVEEFQTNNSALGYEDAKAGDTFVKIGVGVLRKPDEASYSSFNTYDIVDPGRWVVKKGPDWIEFVQTLGSGSGYSYIYRKKIRLVKNEPHMVLEHSLRNTGAKTIQTSVYDHNFFVFDKEASGPDFIVRFPFEARSTGDLKGPATISGKELRLTSILQKGEYVYTHLEGFNSVSEHNDIRVENRKTGTGARQRGDRPLSKLAFWSNPSTICPEPFISMEIKPGKTSTWKITYEFYTLAASH
jgi:hypothetical protein